MRPARSVISIAIAACIGLSVSAAGETAAPATPQIAIIIDDLGYRKATGERAIRLPGPVAVAILPFSAHAETLAAAAATAGKELILHAPMEPQNQVPWEPGGLSGDLSVEDLHVSLHKMLDALPQAVGINNHMGSKFTEDSTAVTWLMGELKQRALFFVDSVTTPATVAWSTAQAHGVPSARRDVFLDNIVEPEAIETQVELLLTIARKRGYALGIGHPHTTTLDVLELYLPRLPALGVELVSVAQLIDRAEHDQTLQMARGLNDAEPLLEPPPTRQ